MNGGFQQCTVLFKWKMKRGVSKPGLDDMTGEQWFHYQDGQWWAFLPIWHYPTHVGYSCHPSPTSPPMGMVPVTPILFPYKQNPCASAYILSHTNPPSYLSITALSNPISYTSSGVGMAIMAWYSATCPYRHTPGHSPYQHPNPPCEWCSCPSQWHWHMCMGDLGKCRSVEWKRLHSRSRNGYVFWLGQGIRNLHCPQLLSTVHSALPTTTPQQQLIHVYCNNSSIIKQLQQSSSCQYPRDAIWDDYPIFAEVQALIQAMLPLKFLFHHVKGHQKETADCKLTLPEKLNIDCNSQVTTLQPLPPTPPLCPSIECSRIPSLGYSELHNYPMITAYTLWCSNKANVLWLSQQQIQLEDRKSGTSYPLAHPMTHLEKI